MARQLHRPWRVCACSVAAPAAILWRILTQGVPKLASIRVLRSSAILFAIALGLIGSQAIAQKTDTKADNKAEVAKPRDLSNDQKAVDLLRRMEEKFGEIKSVSGQFQQVREDPAFEERIESYANFALLKPNKFRADYQPPRQSTNLITDEYYYRYVKDLKQVERYHFQGRLNAQDFNYMVLGFGVKTEDALKVYSVKWLTDGVAKGYDGMQLVPLDPKSNFKYITMLITKDTLQPAQISMEQLDGVRTTVNLMLSTLKIGSAIDPKVFTPDFPRDAQIVDIQ